MFIGMVWHSADVNGFIVDCTNDARASFLYVGGKQIAVLPLCARTADILCLPQIGAFHHGGRVVVARWCLVSNLLASYAGWLWAFGDRVPDQVSCEEFDVPVVFRGQLRYGNVGTLLPHVFYL